MSRQGAGQPLAIQVGPVSSKSRAVFFPLQSVEHFRREKAGSGCVRAGEMVRFSNHVLCGLNA